MFNLFRRRGFTDLSWVGMDMHSHLLPAIDDGVSSVASSITCLKNLLALGLKGFVLTPHVYDDVFPNDHSTIDRAHEVLYGEMERANLADIYTHSSAEYMLGEKFNALLEAEVLRPFPTNHLLVEMPRLAGSIQLEQVINHIIAKGYKPILAHPERYSFYESRLQTFHNLKDMGCLLQLNLLSAIGYYGKRPTAMARYLIENNMYDFLGTDLHHERQLRKIIKYVKSGDAYKDLGCLTLRNYELL